MATLKISDLSVGDWVRCRGRNGRIERLDVIRHDERIRVAVESDLGTMYQFVGIEDIDPIPITAEILEANGIHRTYEDDKYTIFRGDGLWAVKYSDGDWELSTPPVCRVDIRYIHDLQHAIRLAGLDREINL